MAPISLMDLIRMLLFSRMVIMILSRSWYSQAVYDPNAEEYYLEDDTLLFGEIKGFSISKRRKSRRELR